MKNEKRNMEHEKGSNCHCNGLTIHHCQRFLHVVFKHQFFKYIGHMLQFGRQVTVRTGKCKSFCHITAGGVKQGLGNAIGSLPEIAGA